MLTFYALYKIGKFIYTLQTQRFEVASLNFFFVFFLNSAYTIKPDLFGPFEQSLYVYATSCQCSDL